MRMHGLMARFALFFGLLFGAGGAAQADYLYGFATPDGGILQFTEPDFIQANDSGAPYSLNTYGGSGTFDSTTDTTYYFSNVVLASQSGGPNSQNYVGFQVALAGIPTAVGEYPVTSYLFVTFDSSNGTFPENTEDGGQLTISEVPFGGPQPVPEPATLTLMALGLAGLAMVRRRSRGA